MLGTSDHKKINGNRLWDDKLLNQPWDYLFVSDRVPKNEWLFWLDHHIVRRKCDFMLFIFPNLPQQPFDLICESSEKEVDASQF